MYLKQQIDVIQPTENINTRSALSGVTLSRKSSRTSIGSCAFKITAPKVYNSIPLEIRKIIDIGSFKAKLKTFIFSECYDLMDETINEEFKTY